MNLREAMTRNPLCVGKHDDIKEADDLMRYSEVRQLPVIDDGRLVGVVTRADLEVARGFATGELKAGHIMNEAPWVVPPDAQLREVLHDMYRFKLEFVLVAEADTRKVLGIFTRQDALRLLLKPRAPRAQPVKLASRPLRIVRAA
jgi:CBS domain-containing protein